MEVLHAIWEDVLNFFYIPQFLKAVKTNDYHSFMSFSGIVNVLRVFMPVLLFVEIIANLFRKKFKTGHYKIPFLTYLFNAVVGRLLSLTVVLFCIALFEPYKLFSTSFTWYWFIYAYVVYEFANFLHHYLAHKVRLLWCMHSTHHFPNTINLAVAYNRFFFEQPYIDFVKTSICILMGIEPAMFFLIIVVDEVWGLFIHIGEDYMPKGRLGLLGRFVFTPAHHRVHHAKNPLYMDTNYSVLLNIWDRLFRTYQPEVDEVKVEYGITRTTNPKSFLDAHFGELKVLIKDVAKAPGIKNKILYIFMPPGWSHTGDHRTASKMRSEYLKSKVTEVV